MSVILTPDERAALEHRRDMLLMTVSLGPLQPATVPEMMSYGLNIDEALDYVNDFDQAEHDAHYARGVIELQALTAALDHDCTAA